MEILDLQTSPGEAVSRFASSGFTAATVGRIQGGHLAWLRLTAGGRIGRHPAVGHQLLLLVSGDATVSGHDDVSVELIPGQAAVWAPGELHQTVSAGGMSAFVIEGSLELRSDVIRFA
ncbi:MAG: hypothetical protein QOF10_6421 [Kribbellaceae bacterium]|jgi:hypothetical protein|nr:hypothetical protein [Kribbellaceae bacterium]